MEVGKWLDKFVVPVALPFKSVFEQHAVGALKVLLIKLSAESVEEYVVLVLSRIAQFFSQGPCMDETRMNEHGRVTRMCLVAFPGRGRCCRLFQKDASRDAGP